MLGAGLVTIVLGWAGGAARADLGAVGPAAEPAVMPIASLLSLPADVRHRGVRTRIRAVVTMWQRPEDVGVVQDDSAGIWVVCWDNTVKGKLQGVIRPGLEVILDGSLDRGGYSPLLVIDRVEFVKEVDLPEPKPADLERLFTGGDNGLRVTCTGIVQGVVVADRRAKLVLVRGMHRMVVHVLDARGLPPKADLLDARVRITGVIGSVRNTRGEFLAPRMVAPSASDLAVLKPAPAGPAAVPEVPLAEIGRYQFVPATAHRIATQGTVTYASGDILFLQDGLAGVRVQTNETEAVAIGDRVRVTGFVENVRRIAGIREAVFERLEAGTAPAPTVITPDEILRINAESLANFTMATPSDYDGCLVTFSAKVIETRESPLRGGEVVLSSGGSTVVARVGKDDFPALASLRPDSSVRVTGVVQVHLSDDEPTSTITVAPSLPQVDLLIRSPADVEVLAAPSWWTPRRLAALLTGALAVLAGALVWVALLRREVASQARMLAREMRMRRDAAVDYRASLRERNRLAANLHDTLLQTLAGIDFQLGACRARGGPEATDHLEVASRMVDHATKELRGSVWALRTIPMAGRTFGDALETMVHTLRQGYDIGITVGSTGRAFDMPNFVAGNLLLVAQEAIRNALHHSGGRTVDLLVIYDDAKGDVTLQVRDDGRGFEPGTEAGPELGHFGIQGIRERVERLGGTLQIESGPGQGTTIRARVLTREYDADLEDPVQPLPDPAGSAS